MPVSKVPLRPKTLDMLKNYKLTKKKERNANSYTLYKPLFTFFFYENQDKMKLLK